MQDSQYLVFAFCIAGNALLGAIMPSLKIRRENAGERFLRYVACLYVAICFLQSDLNLDQRSGEQLHLLPHHAAVV